jgi:large subunit ribosomal protein L25
MTEELAVDVPLVAHGLSPLVELQGGTLIHPLEHIRVRALPENLPQSIEYSVDSLTDFDQSIHVSDLAIPSDVTLLTDLGEVVAKILRARVEEEPEPAAEAEEGAEEAAEGAEGAEGAAGDRGGPSEEESAS